LLDLESRTQPPAACFCRVNNVEYHITVEHTKYAIKSKNTSRQLKVEHIDTREQFKVEHTSKQFKKNIQVCN